MTERERLIELLNKKYDHFCDQCGVNKDSRYTENLADYLLESGVNMPPVKVHDIIYIADENSNEFTGIDECRVSKLEWNGVFWAIFVDKDYCGYSESEIGKTVFLTREEAEKALEGGENNDKLRTH